MDRKVVEVLVFTLIVAGLFLLTVQDRSFTGFTIFEGSCNMILNESGVWELNNSLSCSSGTVLIINTSNVLLNCQGYSITGALPDTTIGLALTENQTNVSITNCSFSGIVDPIVISDGTTLTISNSTATANASCITGSWIDEGNNRGCLDIIAPALTLTNATIYVNQTLAYQVNASDLSPLNYSMQAATPLTLNTSGWLTNSSTLSVSNYSINITIIDENANEANDSFTLHVRPLTTTTITNTTSGSNSSSSSSSSSSTQTTTPSSTITDQQADALAALADLACTPDWNCTWTACTNGTRQALECTDLNACSDSIPPSSEACQELTTSSITGNAIEGETSRFSPAIRAFFSKNRMIVVFIIAFIAIVGVVFYYVRKEKQQSVQQSLILVDKKAFQ